jgi:uncharacterized membrane protein YeaQ/YmgE (transglycosylase-associated protein family)
MRVSSWEEGPSARRSLTHGTLQRRASRSTALPSRCASTRKRCALQCAQFVVASLTHAKRTMGKSQTPSEPHKIDMPALAVFDGLYLDEGVEIRLDDGEEIRLFDSNDTAGAASEPCMQLRSNMGIVDAGAQGGGNSGDSSSSSSFPMAAIIGAVVGAVLLIVLAVLIMSYRRSREKWQVRQISGTLSEGVYQTTSSEHEVDHAIYEGNYNGSVGSEHKYADVYEPQTFNNPAFAGAPDGDYETVQSDQNYDGMAASSQSSDTYESNLQRAVADIFGLEDVDDLRALTSDLGYMLRRSSAVSSSNMGTPVDRKASIHL